MTAIAVPLPCAAGDRTDRRAPIDVMREAMRRELGPAADG